MKSTSLLMIGMAESLSDQPGQCGLELTESQRSYCRVRIIILPFDVKQSFKSSFEDWSPPICPYVTHACERHPNDYCRYRCIWREECKDKIEMTPVGEGFVCNCVKHDPLRYEFVWSCDNQGVSATTSDENHQYGSVLGTSFPISGSLGCKVAIKTYGDTLKGGPGNF